MLAETLLASTPLGTVLLISDGTPRPPERFNKKLAAWKTRNYTGTLYRIDEPDNPTQRFGIREGLLTDDPLFIVQRLYTKCTPLHFRVLHRPTPGSARVVRANRREIFFIGADRAEAERWLAAKRFSDAVIEIIAEDEATPAEDAI